MTTKKSRVFITGDIHCPIDIDKLNSKCFDEGNNLTKNDILIICGDAGFVWNGGNRDKKWIEWISRRPWTTVYVDGNHENHNLLKTYPVIHFFGAKAHKISDSLFHIKRGEIMTINDETYFCFGGAFSHDIEYRIENISWWQDELPVQEEIDNAIANLKKYHNQINYIITHDVPSSINMHLGYNIPIMDYYTHGKYIHLCNFLQNILESVNFDAWFAGHYHINKLIGGVQILYQDIIEIKRTNDSYQCYEKVKNKINEINSKKYTKEELEELFKEEKLYISYQKIDTIDNFGYGENAIEAEKFFDVETTEDELDAVMALYNSYLVKKYTRED